MRVAEVTYCSWCRATVPDLVRLLRALLGEQPTT